MSKKYNEQSISSLKGADRVRKRPSVMFGSDGIEGCEHSFFEILSNSIDEAREGFGKEIIVTVFRDFTIEVDDHGRGIPLGFNPKENRFAWELIYCELYAGGKYNNNDQGSYTFALGLNGLGACATQYSSEFMEVKSYDGTTLSEINFKKGEAVTQLATRPLERREKRTGTVTKWRPDLEVFTDIAIPHDYYKETLKKQAVTNAGLKFILKIENESGKFDVSEYIYENGISQYVAEIAEETSLTAPVFWSFETRGRDRDDKKDYALKAEIAFCISNTTNRLEYYHNSSYLEHGGSPERAVRAAFTYAIDKQIRSAGKYNKNEAKITFADIEDCLILITNSFSSETSYANQTKKAITNSFIAEAMTDYMKQQLEIYFAENPFDSDKIVNQVLINKRSRERSETARLDLKKKLSGTMDMANRIDKFVSCRSKDPELRELYIVEGDSALTSCKLGRNAEFQAIIAVRGKTLNCLKSTYDKIFKNEIILNLLKVIGCGVEINTKAKGDMIPFSLSSLRWSKIILCTDADEDGFQIRTLLLTIFYRLLPSLIRENKIFIAESPLYEITAPREKIYFAYNEPEKAEIIKKLGSTKYTLQRSKGLGENEPEMMWETTMNPETRRLICVKQAEAEATSRMFDTLLGDDITSRKEFIAKNGNKYLSLADI